MLKIDAHQHYWQYQPVKDSWITDDMTIIQKDFFPVDVTPLMQEYHMDGCVAVQADQSEQENDFLIDLAQKNAFIKGIVGWVYLKAANIEERLQHYSALKIIKGFRHVLQAEADDRYMLGDQFMRGIDLLSDYDFTYDILIKPNHLQYANEFIAAFPQQRFVIDHLAKPYIKDRQLEAWQTGIAAIAQNPNVSCKISGMVTEADWQNHEPADFEPYLDVVFNAFGPKRVMFGSDWPVCNLAGGYKSVLNSIEGYINRLSLNEQELFWGKNAIAFYQLEL